MKQICVCLFVSDLWCSERHRRSRSRKRFCEIISGAQISFLCGLCVTDSWILCFLQDKVNKHPQTIYCTLVYSF